MPDITVLRTRLAEAENALHALMVGEREVMVKVHDYGETSFSQVNRGDLERYITDLKDQIAKAEGRPKRKILYTRF